MIRLYGFRSDAEREWFRLLQTVQGVGAKVALGILSALDPGALATAIAMGDKGAVSRGPGVGPKLAATHRRGTEGQGPGLRGRRPGAGPPLRSGGAPQRAAAGLGRGLGLGQSRLRPGASLGGGRRRAQAGGEGGGGEDAADAGVGA